MAIDLNTAKFLVSAHERGVKFTQTLTLGRQAFWPQAQYKATTAEDFFSLLGAQKIDSLDASVFEGASIIHDLNEPLPALYREQYDSVFDGGTLEHVFNFPVAIRNAMEAVKIGGHLLLHTPINNCCGHGFYQFSPELFYRVLSEENGFKISQMVAFSLFPVTECFEVKDPAQTNGRVEIRYDPHQVLLWVLAQRTRKADIFKAAPQQSDYVSAWQKRDVTKTESQRNFVRRLRDAWRSGWLPYAVVQRLAHFTKSKNLIDTLNNRRHSRKFQPSLFDPIDRDDV
jgi:hypothetical protein